MFRIEKSEWIIIALFAAFTFIWLLLINPYLQGASWFYTMDVYSAYLLYHLGWIAFFILCFGIILPRFIGVFTEKEFSLFDSLRIGISSYLIVDFIYDMFQGPFYLDSNGRVLLPLGTSSLQNTAVDTLWATIWGNVVSGQLLYIFTYVVTPIFAVILAALLLSPKTFVKLLAK